MLTSSVKDGSCGQFVTRRAEREKARGCSRQDMTVPVPVGASRSLRGEAEMPRFTFGPAASNTCCEPGMPYKRRTM